MILGAGRAQAVLDGPGPAQLADESEGRLTRTRQFVGTLRYASPEQVLAVPLDRRSDVYSLGATLWELLTLRPLFGATEQTPTPELMHKIQYAEPERPRKLNPGARGPGSDRAEVPGEGPVRGATPRRPTWPADVARWQRGEPVQSQPPTLGYLLQKSIRRHRVGVALVSSLVLAALLGTGLIVTHVRDAQDRPCPPGGGGPRTRGPEGAMRCSRPSTRP